MIGRTRKHSNVLNGPVLIGRGLDHTSHVVWGVRIHYTILSAPAVLVVCGLRCYGGHSGGETPGYIPNPVAKPSSADGTALVTVWESRTPPDKHVVVWGWYPLVGYQPHTFFCPRSAVCHQRQGSMSSTVTVAVSPASRDSARRTARLMGST